MKLHNSQTEIRKVKGEREFWSTMKLHNSQTDVGTVEDGD